MQGSLRKQPQIKILPVPSINKRLGLREADIDEVMKTVQGVLPQQLDDDIDVTITLFLLELRRRVNWTGFLCTDSAEPSLRDFFLY